MKESASARLYSRNNQSVFRDGFHATFHLGDKNVTHFYHFHDYYEVAFYFGTEPLEYLYDGTAYTLTKGDVIFCDIFRPHMYLCEDNTGRDRFDFGISASLLAQFSLPSCDLTRLFQRQETASPVCHLDFFQLSRYMQLISEYRELADMPDAPGILEGLIHLILAYLHRDTVVPSALTKTEETHSALINTLVQYINEHLTDSLSGAQLAQATHYSASYLSQLFRKATGETLVQYILEKRIMTAKQMIQKGFSPGEAASGAGFRNYSYFYRCFSRLEGMTPKEYRAALRQG